MKRFIFGIILIIIGLLYSLICFVYAILNPWISNDKTGLIVSLNQNHVLIPFLISVIILCLGILVCGYEAYKNK